jgi:hypothetical protein
VSQSGLVVGDERGKSSATVWSSIGLSRPQRLDRCRRSAWPIYSCSGDPLYLIADGSSVRAAVVAIIILFAATGVAFVRSALEFANTTETYRGSHSCSSPPSGWSQGDCTTSKHACWATSDTVDRSEPTFGRPDPAGRARRQLGSAHRVGETRTPNTSDSCPRIRRDASPRRIDSGMEPADRAEMLRYVAREASGAPCRRGTLFSEFLVFCWLAGLFST